MLKCRVFVRNEGKREREREKGIYDMDSLAGGQQTISATPTRVSDPD